MGLTVGIDLGTTNSAVARVDEYDKAVIIPNAEGEAVTPSCVAFTENGVIVGSEAKSLKQAGSSGVAAFFKREMGNENYVFTVGDRDYTPVDLSAFVLKKLKNDAEAYLGRPITDAVITVPAYFRETERRNTVEAAELAGLNVLKTINEPTAAALAYGADKGDPDAPERRVLVYDLGGGTFDVTLLDILGDRLQVLSSEGDSRLGGKDWDERVVDYLLDAFRREFGVDPCEDIEFIGDLLIRAEEAKIRLSAALSTALSLRHAGCSGRYELNRALFAELTADLLQRTRSLCDKLLSQTGTPAGGVNEVLLVGGSTRMPMVHDLILDCFGRHPLQGVNVDEAVALGAALEACRAASPAADRSAAGASSGSSVRRAAPRRRYALPGKRTVHDVTNHSLGAIAVSADGSRYVNEILLRKDTPVPCSASRVFILDVPVSGTSLMDVYLTQGETDSPADMAYMAKHVVRKIPGNASGKARIEVTYSYDGSAMVAVSAKDTLTGRELPVTRESLAPGEETRFLGSPSDTPQAVRHTHVLLVIDLSASMTGAPLAEAQKAAHRFVDEMDMNVCSVGLAVTADKARQVCELTRNPSRIKEAVDCLEIGMQGVGFGNGGHPFTLIHDVLSPLNDERTAAVILADGIWYKQEQAVAAAQSCHADDIAIVAIGFGTADKKFLKAVASTDEAGIFTKLDQLSETFSRIARVMGSPATQAGDAPQQTSNSGMLGLLFRK